MNMGKAHKNSQILRHQAQGPHRDEEGALGLCYSFQFGVLVGFMSVRMSGSPIIMPLGALFFCLSYSTQM